jgi:hypothetical protein
MTTLETRPERGDAGLDIGAPSLLEILRGRWLVVVEKRVTDGPHPQASRFPGSAAQFVLGVLHTTKSSNDTKTFTPSEVDRAEKDFAADHRGGSRRATDGLGCLLGQPREEPPNPARRIDDPSGRYGFYGVILVYRGVHPGVADRLMPP